MRMTGLSQKEGVGGVGGALNPPTLASSFFRGISFSSAQQVSARTAFGRPFDWVSCEL